MVEAEEDMAAEEKEDIGEKDPMATAIMEARNQRQKNSSFILMETKKLRMQHHLQLSKRVS